MHSGSAQAAHPQHTCTALTSPWHPVLMPTAVYSRTRNVGDVGSAQGRNPGDSPAETSPHAKAQATVWAGQRGQRGLERFPGPWGRCRRQGSSFLRWALHSHLCPRGARELRPLTWEPFCPLGRRGRATRALPLSGCVAQGKLPSYSCPHQGNGLEEVTRFLEPVPECMHLHTLLQRPDICYILQGAWPLPSSLPRKGQDAAEQNSALSSSSSS